MKFRNDINGLRALAVLAVVLFHFGVPGFGGGFVGVDVFFVISGFLMTRIIFSRLEVGRFSILEFYADRARRILPALVVLCLVLLVLGWWILRATDYAVLGKHVASSLVFVSNHVFRSEAGYFDVASQEKWLLHTWSLSVEGQFYFLYPVAIVLLRRVVAPAHTRWWLAVFAIALLALCIYATPRWPSAAFYYLPFRAWEMLAGGLVCLFPVSLTDRSRRFAERSGFLLIGYSILSFDASLAWPGWFATVPVAGSMLVILSARGDSVLTSNRPSQFLGRISYSVYLWHWPPVVLLHSFDKLGQTAWIASAIILSVLLGYLSFTIIESRFGKKATAPQSAVVSQFAHYARAVLPSLCVVVLGMAVALADGIPGDLRQVNLLPQNVFLAKYTELHKNGLQAAYLPGCDYYDWVLNRSKNAIDRSCTAVHANAPLFIWGDSHAQALSAGLRYLFPEKGEVAQVATSGCAPALHQISQRGGMDNNCVRSNQFALAEIARIKPRAVVLAQQSAHERTDWGELADHLHKLGVESVVLLGPMPNWRPSLPMIITRKHWGRPINRVSDGLDAALFATDAVLAKKYGRAPNLDYISLISALCNTEGCIAVVPNEEMLMVVDYGHLTPLGSIYVAKTVLKAKLDSLMRR
jgi:peptidoglycan/LPS O-acetylase OafA/YrhL